MNDVRKGATVSTNPVKFWRSLDELRGEARRKTINGVTAADRVTREQFLKLMGASLALAGLTACAGEPKGPTKIAPYVQRPVGVSEAESLYFATALTHQGYANGVLVRQVAGRPIKVEGNVEHPASLGATTSFAQGAMLTFYDPDRSAVVLQKGQQNTWENLTAALTTAATAQTASRGAGLRVLTETVTSPSLTDQLQTLLKTFPAAKWHIWEPINRDNVREGARQAFGQVVDPRYHLDQADVIVTLDADLFNGLPGSLRYAREFGQKRRVTTNRATQNRLYAIESAPTTTGMAADHRLAARSADIAVVAEAIAAGVGVAGATAVRPTGVSASWIAAVVKDLTGHRGTSLVVAGDEQPPIVHVLAHQINQTLGNVGKTVDYTDPVEANPVDRQQSLRELVQDMSAGKVNLLLILGANPAYTAPADLDFAAALAKVAQSVHLGLYVDETGKLATWHAPRAHELEAWDDARAFDGTTTILQPLINPLHGGKTPQELLAVLNGKTGAIAHDLVKGYWQQQVKTGDFAAWWRTTLNDGIIGNTALPPRTITPKAATIAGPTASPPQGVEIIFRADPTVYDGRYANNGWLQELPKPLTTLTWDNAVEVAPALASRLGLTNEDVVELRYRGKTLRAPVWVLAGHPDNAATVHLGYGRTAAGQVGTGLGHNAYALRASDAPWSDGGLDIVKTGERYTLAATQTTQTMEGRDIVRAGTLAEYQQDPHFIQKEIPELAGTLYPPFTYDGNRWGMAINLSSCIGCNACTIACQAENNIPVVGKDQVNRGRHMHWIRVDRYYEGAAEDPTSYTMPVPCMQCENAPCELVCPVGATTHSAEGLNDMVYNRCVGTRYCSNNCPYKVRRFNFYQYSDYTTPIYQLMYNPDVTVRERGVMEKCTYCVQRIRHAEVRAGIEGRPIRDGEVVTACQAVCPTQAIVFGDLNDKSSKVAALRADVLNYDLLGELNTRPRTFYLAAIRNVNPEVKVE
ncbi:MAG TPA: 4Fe-4S dicluster domain-containing protein [Chloroflexota bacterium]|nr:4Fe-4S dicluster domain-containing protein [Chloroflexota bacterium]